ncbi:MAG: MIP family channel protein [Clostridia bacterium]
MSLTKKAIAECLGTFVLVFFACGVAVVTKADVVATALSFGLVIVAMAYSIGGISGCHINPAVSLGMLIAKRMSLKEFFVYIVSQFLGAILGACALYGLLTLANFNIAIWATNGYINGVSSAGSIFASLGVEIILTFVFVYTILCVTAKKEHSAIAGVVIGLTLTLVHLIGINLTGTSVNPARSFGPALMALLFGGGTVAISQVWLFIVAPLIGGALSAIVFKFLNKEEISVAS